jgi:WD domain, G-beta repeat
MAFSPDGRLLATGGYEQDDIVRVWEVATCQEIARFTGHHSGVGSLAFTPDGRTLASGAGDATILLWDLTSHALDSTFHPGALSPDRLERCWKDLGSSDAGLAYRAARALAADPTRSVPFLEKHLRPAEPVDAARLKRLIAGLDADAFRDREDAEAELAKLGEAAETALRKLCDGSPSTEARMRAERLLQKRSSAPEAARSRRAIAALEYAGNAADRRLLETLANGLSGALLTEEARSTLARLKEQAAVQP